MPDLTEQLRALVAKWREELCEEVSEGDIAYNCARKSDADELSALLAAAEGVERDAARYRWLREHDNADLLAEDVIDEAIDSMRDSGEGES